MTKKHFKKLAEAVSKISDAQQRAEMTNLIGQVCDDFNLNFDWERWSLACEGLEYRK